MFIGIIIIVTAVWAWKATKGWQERSLIVANLVAFLLVAQVVPLMVSELAGAIAALVSGIACIAVLISLGGKFRSQRMKEALAETDEMAPGVEA